MILASAVNPLIHGRPVRTELLWRGRNRIRNTLFHYIYINIHIYLYHNTLSLGYLWCFIETAGWDWDSEFEAEPHLLIRMQRWYKGSHVFCFPSKTLFSFLKFPLKQPAACFRIAFGPAGWWLEQHGTTRCKFCCRMCYNWFGFTLW